MKWRKIRNIFLAENENKDMISHAQIPTPIKLSGNTFRIFFSSRNNKGKTLPYYLDFDVDKAKVTFVQKTPLLQHGRIGTFDDSGIMPSSVIQNGGLLYMYYIGWNPQVTVSYRLSIGLAISQDMGRTFDKYSEGPLLDRGIDEPFFNTAPCVIRDDNIFKMWYVSCTGWEIIKEKPEPLYLIRYAESEDGIHWKKFDQPSINYKWHGEAIGRPWVFKDTNLYHMWYSTRGSIDYREKEGQHYTIGYATSPDGKTWTRKDDEAGIKPAASGWDSEMIEYCAVEQLSDGTKIMLYNGNGFGISGFGYALS